MAFCFLPTQSCKNINLINKGNCGLTPFMIACICGHTDVAKLLLVPKAPSRGHFEVKLKLTLNFLYRNQMPVLLLYRQTQRPNESSSRQMWTWGHQALLWVMHLQSAHRNAFGNSHEKCPWINYEKNCFYARNSNPENRTEEVEMWVLFISNAWLQESKTTCGRVWRICGHVWMWSRRLFL